MSSKRIFNESDYGAALHAAHIHIVPECDPFDTRSFVAGPQLCSPVPFDTGRNLE